jgi:hypothetical protein
MEMLFSNIYNSKNQENDKNIDYSEIDVDEILSNRHLMTEQDKQQALVKLNEFSRKLCPSVEMIALSNYYCKELGFTTTFFGDEISLKMHKNIEFDNFKLIPKDFIDNSLKCFWSSGKLYALRNTQNPCYHIDSDLFLTKPLPPNFLKQDIVCFHSEYFREKDFQVLQNLFEINPVKSFNFPTISYNCGIMGGQDYQSMHKAIDILFDFLNKNKTHINKVNKENENNKEYFNKDIFYPAVLFEQIWLFQILKSLGKNISELIQIHNWKESFLNETQKSGYVHLMRYKVFYIEKIKRKIKDLNIQC